MSSQRRRTERRRPGPGLPPATCSRVVRAFTRAGSISALLGYLALAMGCYTPYSKQALPMRLFDEREAISMGYRIGERVSLDEEGFRIFSWPVTEPSAIDVANRMIDHYQAVGIANMEVDYTEWAILFFWSYPAVTITADLVLDDERPRPHAAPTTDPGPSSRVPGPPDR